jgi:hypothetical protein
MTVGLRNQPHHTGPDKTSVRVGLAYKNFGANKNISHIGLGVAATCNQASLRRAGYWSEVWACNTAQDIHNRIVAANNDAVASTEHKISHVVISAPWVPTADLQKLLTTHPTIDWVVVSHSNVGFLAADPGGIQRLRDAVELQVGYVNFRVGGNSQKFCDAWTAMNGHPALCLPNMYDLAYMRQVGHRTPWNGSEPLRIGVFGAQRPLKNMITSAAAAVELATQLKTHVQLSVSGGRAEGGATAVSAVQQLITGRPNITINEIGWRSWPAFREIVRQQHVLLNSSFTESFCMVVADGICEGVASVCSEAIDWVPDRWHANSDNVGDVARVANQLLHDTRAVDDGQAALKTYVQNGQRCWDNYLTGVR